MAKFIEKRPPRSFKVGKSNIKLNHVADIALENNEFVTFIFDEGLEYDVTKKDWGFYATPSIESRLKNNKLRVAVMENKCTKKRYIVLVQEACMDQFSIYMKLESLEIACWL